MNEDLALSSYLFDTTQISTIKSPFTWLMISIDYREPVEETMPPMNECVFGRISRSIIKGSPKKRKNEQLHKTSHKQLMDWNAPNLNHKEFTNEAHVTLWNTW